MNHSESACEQTRSITLVFQASADPMADLGDIVTSNLKSSMHYILNINLVGRWSFYRLAECGTGV
jgi:hypothetical protein